MGKDIPKAIMKTTYCVFSYPVPFYIECPYYTIVPQLCQTTAMTYAASADTDACGNFIMAVLNHFFRTFRNISIVILHTAVNKILLFDLTLRAQYSIITMLVMRVWRNWQTR